MGNIDGILSSMVNRGTNKVININKKWHFSFAYGNEIALTDNSNYYILNCDNSLWLEVKKKVKTNKRLSVLKKWWKSQSLEYEVSDWSQDFNDL